MGGYMKDGGDNHTGGSGSWKDGQMHFTNFDSESNTRTSYDEDYYGNVSGIHSVDQNTNEKTQYDINRDGDPRKY